jgi:hypothetical protein
MIPHIFLMNDYSKVTMRRGCICLLASVLAVIIFACTYPMNIRATDDLRLLLNEEQTEILDEIVKERSRIAFEGLMIGLLVALPFILLFRMCLVASIILFMSQGMYYHLKPKTKWLLNNLDTKEQVDGWLQVYKKMQRSGVLTSFGVTTVYLSALTFFQG